MPEETFQCRSFFGSIEALVECHDLPRGVNPKYTILAYGEGGTLEPHFISPPRYFFFVSPGHYDVTCLFLGVQSERVPLVVQQGETSSVKFHFHYKPVPGISGPPPIGPRQAAARPAPSAPAPLQPAPAPRAETYSLPQAAVPASPSAPTSAPPQPPQDPNAPLGLPAPAARREAVEVDNRTRPAQPQRQDGALAPPPPANPNSPSPAAAAMPSFRSPLLTSLSGSAPPPAARPPGAPQGPGAPAPAAPAPPRPASTAFAVPPPPPPS